MLLHSKLLSLLKGYTFNVCLPLSTDADGMGEADMLLHSEIIESTKR